MQRVRLVADAATVIRRLGLDVGLWCCIPALFMALYVMVFSQPAAAVMPHLAVIALPLIATLLVRVMLSRLVSSQGVNHLTASLLISLVLTLLITYYALILISLASWGGVPSLEAIPTFLRQSETAADTLHVPSLLIDVAPILVFAGFTWGCYLYLIRFDWTIGWVKAISNWTVAAIVMGGSAILAISLIDFSFGAGTQVSEPISLTIFSHRDSLDLEGYTVNPVVASRVDRATALARSAYVPSRSADPKNIVLIVVDALRPDHMGIYGYGRDTTPNLARLSREVPTRIIQGTHASCGDTACAMFSLFSSKFPSEFSFHPFFLHEALRRDGYKMRLILSGDHTFFFGMKNFYGPVEGFYDGGRGDGRSLNDDQQVLDQLALLPNWDGTPVMFQFHLMSAHVLRSAQRDPGPFIPAARYGLEASHDIGPGGVPKLSAVNFYDNGVLKADSVVNSLLSTLQSKAYLRNAVVVITADHGEALGEHGLFKHANSVREELLSIPLILLYYGCQPRVPERTRAYPSQVDIAPTILTELALPIPSVWVGLPLQMPRDRDFSFFVEHAFAGLIDHRDPSHIWKYWSDRHTGDDHVFDLNTDPHEDHDLRDVIPSYQLGALRARLRAETASDLAVR